MSARVEAAVAELVAAIRNELRDEQSTGPIRLLTVEEAAEQAGIGRSMAYDLIRRGELRSIRIGRLRRVPSDAIAALATKEAARDGDRSGLEDRERASAPTTSTAA